MLDEASRPYRQAGQFAWRFARGKLSADTAFRHILEHGLIAPRSRVLDLGCGQGLLASLLNAASHMEVRGAWPREWQQPPIFSQVHGIELMEADERRAREALGSQATFVQGDICTTPFGPANVMVILDVLHYIGYDAQIQVLSRLKESLNTGGLLLLRVGDAAGGMPFRISNWVDRAVTFARGHRLSRLYCRTLSEWTGELENLGFMAERRPMSAGTPFANVLLVARRG
ncbi:MAG: class I SAM-dependent methyltransferase [Betaproteobacteria bacterium]|nr:class I SAM-dependent methyltransferase [Betaproteobacteria bacterium]